MQTITHDEALRVAAQAKHWPTITDLVASSGIPGRTIRKAIADGDLAAFRLNVLRVSPEAFAAWIAGRQK